MTVVTDGFISDEAYKTVQEQFSEKEIVELTMVIATINTWNRLAISARSTAGSYQLPKKA